MTLHTVGVSIDFRNSACSLVSVGIGVPHVTGATLPIGGRFASAPAPSDPHPMTTHPHSRDGAPYWSLPGLAEGARRCGAMVPGTFVFAAAYGTLAAQKGLTLSEAVLMSALMFAGSAQLVALEVWSNPLTLATVISLAVVTGIVNARFILMSATMRPWLGPLPAWQSYGALMTTVDATWLIGMRYRSEGGSDASVYLGAGLALYAVWVVAAVPAYPLGALVTAPN